MLQFPLVYMILSFLMLGHFEILLFATLHFSFSFLLAHNNYFVLFPYLVLVVVQPGFKSWNVL